MHLTEPAQEANSILLQDGEQLEADSVYLILAEAHSLAGDVLSYMLL